MEKISKELDEKERLNILRKKQRILEGIIDSSSDSDGNASDDSAQRLKKKDIKKIYPVSISYHQETKLLAICLIDCDIKIYQLKMHGTSLHVNEYY